MGWDVTRLCVIVYTVCLVFCLFVLYCIVSTSTRCVACLCVSRLHGVFSALVFYTHTMCSVVVCSVAIRCVQRFSAVPTNCVQWFVLCTYIMCSELVCFVPNECVQWSCFVHLHFVFSTSLLDILGRLVKFSSEIFRELFLQFAMCCTVDLAAKSMFCLLPDFSRGVQITVSTLLC